MEHYSVVIVGGGPIGLYAAGRLQEKGISYHLFEAETLLGGQPASLYPAKEVVDVPGFPPQSASDVVKTILAKVNPANISVETPVTRLTEKRECVEVKAAEKTIEADYVFLATGLGFHKPRLLGLPDEEKCANILYALKDPLVMKGKRVLIFGGGDSALDWARDVSKLSKHVSLIHRRTEFRGDVKTIEGCPLTIYLPYIPVAIHQKNGLCDKMTIQNVNDNTTLDMPCDYVLVNYGQIPSPSTFDLPLTSTGFGVLVDEKGKATPRIFALGDCSYFPEKKKRIEPGMKEVEAAISSLAL
jgi:ferredoxin/flavodoxin---NADP+ reductase